MTDTTGTQHSLFDARETAATFTVRHSRRARRLTVRVFVTGRVEVVVPPRTPERMVRDFVSRHREWIATRRERARRDRPPPAIFPPAVIELAAFAECWSLHMRPGRGRLQFVTVAPGALQVHGDAPDGELRRLLRAWVRRRSAARLGPWLESLARETGLGYGRMVVRSQRTRWGSCSSRGTISLNANLAFQRPAVVRYLLLHELAHTRYMNHSSRFWNLVAAFAPDWHALDRELSQGWRHVPAWMRDDGD
ncbi:MAG TPA: SprT family zinc-dependent metalloprotease [Steroidobacteraceae bacterium]|nr:M48 family metallopeptidase [Steroidobacteraceae bacterium]HQW09303.1 SprT family zinc-dependent metalloprotease [Steroidobacteraceae bacterium]HQX47154.1 SprT family zinc-dependent metalloprotease [Steroidobacteraceae bacterium]HQX78145.1 SprT family zinc-dependent metalloprotease [Steroidobacteraceae bacterium]HQZ79095.1 SprT family zinc-dependent metalloprotease [Steroidobacteraceae bacterium]